MGSQYNIDVVLRGDNAVRGLGDVNKSLSKTDGLAAGVKRQFSGMFAAFGVGVAVNHLRKLSDSFTEIQNQLRVVTEGTDGLASATDDLFAIATKTRAPVRELAILYQRASLASANLGASQKDVKKFIEATGNAIAIQGGGMGRARGAMIQLSQAIGGAVVRAEEFNSIQEGALPIILTVAKHMKGGALSFAELRQRVIEGKVSSKEFFEAFIAGAKDLEDAFGKTIPTIAQAFTVLNNQTIKFIGGSEDVVAASANISNAIIYLGKNLNEAIEIASILAIGLGVKYISALVLANAATLSFAASTALAVLGIIAQTIALGPLTIAADLAFVSMLALNATFVFFTATAAGIALAVTAIGAAIYFAFKDEDHVISKRSADIAKLNKEFDSLKIRTREQAEEELKLKRVNLESSRAEVDKTLAIRNAIAAQIEASTATDGWGGSLGGAAFHLRDLKKQLISANADLDIANKNWVDAWVHVGNLTDNITSLDKAFAEKEIVDYDKKLVKLLSTLDPATTATIQYAESLEILTRAGKDSVAIQEKMPFLVAQLDAKYTDLKDPIGAVSRALAASNKVLLASRGLSEDEIELNSLKADIIKSLGATYSTASDERKKAILGEIEYNFALAQGNKKLNDNKIATDKSTESIIDFANSLRDEIKFLEETNGMSEEDIRLKRLQSEAVKTLGKDYKELTGAELASLDALIRRKSELSGPTESESLSKALGEVREGIGSLPGVSGAATQAIATLDAAQKSGAISANIASSAMDAVKNSTGEVNGATQLFMVQQLVLSEAFANNKIAADDYAVALDNVTLAYLNQENAQSETFGESFSTRIQAMAIESKNAFASIGNDVALIFGPDGTFAQGIGDATAKSIIFGDSFKETLRSIGQTILSTVISGLVKIGITEGINFLIRQVMRKKDEKDTIKSEAVKAGAGVAAIAATVIAAGVAGPIVAAAWEPAAIAASLASFGGNSVGALAGIAAVKAALGGAAGVVGGAASGGGDALNLSLADGGYVSGPGSSRSDSIPARLSDGEFVVNAAATRNNLALLEAINNGRSPQAAGSSSRTNNFDGPAFSLTINGRGDESNEDLIATMRDFILDEQRTGGLFEGAA